MRHRSGSSFSRHPALEDSAAISVTDIHEMGDSCQDRNEKSVIEHSPEFSSLPGLAPRQSTISLEKRGNTMSHAEFMYELKNLRGLVANVTR